MARANLCFVPARVSGGAMRFMDDIRRSGRALPGFVLMGLTWATYAAYVPILKAQVGLSDAAFGGVMLFGSIGALAAMLSAPMLARILGARCALVASLSMVLGFLLLSVSGSVALFAVGLFFGAVGTGLLDVVMNAEVSRAETDGVGRGLMNLNHGMFSAAYGLCGLTMAFTRTEGIAPWVVFALILGLALVLVPRLNDLRAETSEGGGDARGLPHMLVLTAGVVVLVAFMAEGSAEGWSALQIERTLGGTAAQGALGPAVMGLAMAVGRIGGHFVRLNAFVFMAMGLVLGATGCILVSATGSVMIAFVGFGLLGLGCSVVGPLALALVGQAVPPELRLAAMSRAVAMGYGAFFMGPPLMGFVSEAFGLPVSFAVMAGMMIAVVVVALPVLLRLVGPASPSSV